MQQISETIHGTAETVLAVGNLVSAVSWHTVCHLRHNPTH